jgi:protein gp37
VSANTSIQWTDRTWNPVRGCSIVSPGCVHCYAMKQAHRFSGPGKPYEGLTKLSARSGPQWTGKVVTVESALLEPLSWRKPQRVFVNSMSDLFHEDVPDYFISEVFATMALAPRHTFQILTKRADRMRRWFECPGRVADVAVAIFKRYPNLRDAERESRSRVKDWPLPNVWLGVSVEDQQRADERIPLLLQTPAAVRFISAEPLLGPLNLGALPRPAHFHSQPVGWETYLADRLHWVIVGGESGPGARPFDLAWARSIVQQCKAAGVACFVKQLGSHVITRNDDGWEGDTPRSWPMDTEYDEDLSGYRDGYQGAPVRVRLKDRKGGAMSEWPVDLRVREFPSEVPA